MYAGRPSHLVLVTESIRTPGIYFELDAKYIDVLDMIGQNIWVKGLLSLLGESKPKPNI